MPLSKHKFEQRNKLTNSCHETIQSHTEYMDKFLLNMEKENLEPQNIGYKNKNAESVHLEIQLDDGKIQFLVPKLEDQPHQLAKKFCLQHQLEDQMVLILAQNIKKTIKKLKENIKASNRRMVTQPCTQKDIAAGSSSKRLETIESKPEFIQKQSHKGNNLYQRCMKQQSSKRYWIQRQKILKSSSQLSQCTHSPKINPISEQIFSKKSTYKSNSQSRRQNQFSSIKTEQSQKYLESIQEKIISNFQLPNKQTQNSSVFQHLYSDGKSKQLKKKQKFEFFLKRNCNFQPKINQTSRRIIGNKSFQQRLHTYRNSSKGSKNKSISDSVQKNNSFIKIKKKQSHPPNQDHFQLVTKPVRPLSIVNRINNSSQNIKKPAKMLPSPAKNIFKIPTSDEKVKKFHQQQNQKLYQNQKKKAFKVIFELLDQDRDGVISILNINLLNGVDQKLIKILFPVLEQLEILETELNGQEFYQAMDNLLRGLSLDEKGYLLKYQSKYSTQQSPKQNEYHSKKPRMTAVSTQLVNQTERKNVTVYEYSKIRQQLKLQRLQVERIQKQKKIMRNCTFHPKVNSKRNYYF